MLPSHRCPPLRQQTPTPRITHLSSAAPRRHHLNYPVRRARSSGRSVSLRRIHLPLSLRQRALRGLAAKGREFVERFASYQPCVSVSISTFVLVQQSS